jgi:hypothetical protein
MTMSYSIVLAAFGGGVFGALIGALPAFIFTGLVGLIGVAIIAGGGSDMILGSVVFGTLLGPHIAFAGGVAAAAYEANRKKALSNGMDILTSPSTINNDPMSLLVGGAFGIIGYLLNYLFGYLEIPTDTVALTVFISGVISRYAFGHTGILGTLQNADGTKRAFFPDKYNLLFIVIYSFGVGAVVSYLVDLTQINVLGFVISAALLMFVQFGFNIPATHHVTLVAGYATVASGSVLVGAVFAVIAGVIGEIMGRTFNNNCDTHIDPPATTIFLCSLFIFSFM